MPDRVVDTHMRFWDLATGWYPGMADYARSVATPELASDFGPDDYRQAVGSFPVDKLLHISAALTPGSYLDELRWAVKLADEHHLDMRYIGCVDATMSPAEIIADLNAQHATTSGFAGIRVVYDFEPDSPAVHTVLSWLTEHDVVFDLVTQPDEMPDWIRALQRFPDLTVALVHTGFPTADDDDAHAEWLEAIQLCARETRASCKVSGLSMTTNTFEPTALRRWIDPAIETFGWDRVMFGSNFPIHRTAGTYQELQASFDAVIGDATADEQDRFYARNAIEVYGFEP
ncbi:amidohydrolase family protein [Gordonia sp. PKS22-38]|uniref:Amidohydrolase family protein n=1 Tax=Gordonia prachuapensis TaxID=3115651 RepID=A0ABU7MXP1_9ACTN|nr:amidohydrolase family protein [Gordonia sp. PKS22-38]